MLGDFALGGFRVLDRVLRRFVCDTELDLGLMGLGVKVLGCRGFLYGLVSGSFPWLCQDSEELQGHSML